MAQVKNNILDLGYLTSVKIYCWNAAVKIDPKDLANDVPSEIVRTMQDIISDKTIIKELRKIKNQVFYFIENNSMPFPLEQAFFVPKQNIEAVSNYLEEMKSKYFEIADELIRNYSRLRTEFKIRYPKNYKIVEKRYPSAERLKEKFRFDWNFYTINAPTSKGFSTIDKSIFAKEKAKFQELMAEMEQNTIAFIQEKLIERCNVLAEQCSDGKINRATMNSISSIVDQWEEIWSDCIEQKSLNSAIKSVRLTLKSVGDVDQFKTNESLQNKVENKLEKIIKRLENLPNKRRIVM